MSKSSKTNHDFGAINISGGGVPIPHVITFTATGNLDVHESGALVICSNTSGSCGITLPIHHGVNYKFIQTIAGNQFGILMRGGNAADNLYGNAVCTSTSVGNSLNNSTGTSDIEFTNTSVIGDQINLVCDGTNYYFSGTYKNIGGVTVNGWTF